MRQFITGSERDYLSLENKAQGKCIRFKNQELPPTFSPGTAHIGFEVDEISNRATLWVSENIAYSGSNQAISQWLRNGKKTFSTFNKLRKWIVTEIKAEFDFEPTSEQVTSRNQRELTDIEEVQNNLPNEDEALYLDEDRLLEDLKTKVIGQDMALTHMCKATVRHCARKRPTRPAVLFAIGPSGVGKTRTAECLCEAITKQNEEVNYNFLRLDMTEYQESHRVSQLIGSPQGYIGHGEGSQLLDAIRSNPRTIILFDEIEKAHPAILKVLMNAMDAGRISSPSRNQNSHTVDCRYAIFIFTSNLDASGILGEAEANFASLQSAEVDDVCRRKLKASGIAPEIIGRIGRFLLYFPLGQKERAKIMTMSIAEMTQEYGLILDYVAPEVIISFMKQMKGNDFGARPAKYLIDEELGGICASAAQQGHKTIKIIGPPYRCELPDNEEEKAEPANPEETEPTEEQEV